MIILVCQINGHVPHDIVTVIEGSEGKLMLTEIRVPQHVPNPPVVVFVHGFKGFKDWGHFPLVAQMLAKAGFACVSFNFSHNGTTIQHPEQFDELDLFAQNNYSKELFDLKKVIGLIKDGTLFSNVEMDGSKIFLLGHSRGGAISLIAAAEDPSISGVVTWASIADMKRTSADLNAWRQDGVIHVFNSRTGQQMPMLYQFVEDVEANSERFDLKNQCAEIKVPVLVIHGDKDAAVPFSDAEKLAEWCPKGILMRVPNGDHTFGGRHPFLGDELPDASNDVLDKTTAHFRSIVSE